MKRFYNLWGRFSRLLYACVLLAACSGCVEDLYQGKNGTTPEENPNGDFSFSPVTKCTLDINYDLAGEKIPFMIYLENPILDDNNTLNESLLPRFGDFTEEDGTFNGTFDLIDGVTHVYLVSTMLGVPNCVELDVTNNRVDFDMSQPMTKASLRAGEEHIYPIDMKVLGTWDDRGVPDYLTTKLTLPNGLLASINATLPSSKSIFEGDFAQYVTDDKVQCVKITEKATVKMAFITESASIPNVLGYYCYPTGETPTDKSQLTKVIAFPCANFSNKVSKNNDVVQYYWGALACGSQVQLKYWNGTELQDEFPAGTTIEFFLATQSFVTNPKESIGSIVNKGENHKPIFYTNPQFNPYQKAQSIALYDENNKLVALGFEDKKVGEAGCDADFNDAVFTLSTNPATALDGDGMPVLKPGDNTNKISYGNQGTLAFEDLWPNQGDYDMNDVVVHYESVVTKTSSKPTSLKDTYTILWSGGSILSGFGYQLPGIPTSAVTSCKVTSDGVASDLSMEEGQDFATIILSNNIRAQVGKTFVVETSFTPQGVTLTPPYNPFIFAGQRGREVHLTNMAPTNAVDGSLLGTKNDVSKPESEIYYVSKDNFPFAIYIPDQAGFTYKIPKESVRIDQAYPEFALWVNSKGSSNTQWYKSPNPDKVESTDK